LAAGLHRQCLFGGLRIGLYEPVKNMFVGKDHVGDVPLHLKIAAGLTTGAFAICVASPTDLVKVRMQSEGKLAPGVPRRYPSAMGAYRIIARCVDREREESGRGALRGQGRGLGAAAAPPPARALRATPRCMLASHRTVCKRLPAGAFFETTASLASAGRRSFRTRQKTTPRARFSACILFPSPADAELVDPSTDTHPLARSPLCIARARARACRSDALTPTHTRAGPPKTRREEGVAGLWKGLSPNIARNAIINAAELASYDQVKQSLLATGFFKDNIVTHLLSGLGAGFVAVCVGSPVDVVKSRVMGDRAGKFSGVMDCFVKTAREEGVGAFYKGFMPNFGRLGSWNVVMFLTLEQVKKLMAPPAASH